MWMQPNYANSDNLLCKEEEMSNCEADHQLILFATSFFKLSLSQLKLQVQCTVLAGWRFSRCLSKLADLMPLQHFVQFRATKIKMMTAAIYKDMASWRDDPLICQQEYKICRRQTKSTVERKAWKQAIFIRTFTANPLIYFSRLYDALQGT